MVFDRVFRKWKSLNDIDPSIYGVHDSGSHNSSSREDHVVMYFQTYVALAAYYKRLTDVKNYKCILHRIRLQSYKMLKIVNYYFKL